MLNEIILHTIYKIRNANIRPWPYPHVIIDQILEPNFYKKLIDNFPTEDQFGRFRQYPKRFQVTLHTGDISHIHPVWTDFRDWFVNNPVLGEHFMTFFYGPDHGIAIRPFGHIIWDRPGYEITQHMDVSRKATTTIIYMPLTREVPKGTVIIHKDEDGTTREVLTVPIRSNRLLAFKPCENSWHAVRAGETVRTSAQLFLMKSD